MKNLAASEFIDHDTLFFSLFPKSNGGYYKQSFRNFTRGNIGYFFNVVRTLSTKPSTF